MKILAVEFSSAQRSVAVAEGSAGGNVTLRGAAEEAGGRSVQALSMVQAALNQAQWPREAIEGIAVGLGPGSYTGIRAAISLAQGWQLARPVGLFGISSMEGLAAEAQSLGMRGSFTFVIDAQRGEFYLARYVLEEQTRSVVEPLAIVAGPALVERSKQGQRIAGPERVPGLETTVLYPTAATLARLAVLGRTGTASGAPIPGVEWPVSGETLKPIYLRETQFVKAPPSREIP